MDASVRAAAASVSFRSADWWSGKVSLSWAHPRTARRRVAVLVAVFTAAMPLAGCTSGAGSAAPADYYQLVDYHWLSPVSNFVASRLQSDLRRVPPLLQQGCQLSDSERTQMGEDYVTHIAAEAALLRLAERDPGALADAVPGAVISRPSGGGWPAKMLDPRRIYAHCLDTWAHGWRFGTPDTRRGWADVVSEVEAIPTFHGTPGTSDVPLCRGSDDGNTGLRQYEWDFQMAWLMRVWGILAGEPASNLPGPLDQLKHDFAVRAWLQGGAADEDHVICGGHVPESENHRLLIRTTKFLHNELLPVVDAAAVTTNDAVGRYDVNTNNDNTTNGIGAILRGAMRDWVDQDFLEYNARPYGRYQMLGLLNLYDFASQQMRNAAEAPLDFLSAKHAAESMDGLRIAPYRRRADDYNLDLATGDTVTPMYDVWVGGLVLPQYIRGAGGEMALAASSDYRPPDILIDRMLNRDHRDFFEQFNGQGQEEAGYGGPDFTITGGGHETSCPYPFAGRCPGSGNDAGTVMPIVLIPHRSWQPDDNPVGDPTTDTLISVVGYDDAEWRALPAGSDWGSVLGGKAEVAQDSCIYRNFACGPYVAVHASVKASPECTRSGNDQAGNPFVLLRFDQTCAGPAYAGNCFFVYKLQMQEPNDVVHPPLSYFVTHSCVPEAPPSIIRDEFDAFGRYMQTTGAPDYRRGDGVFDVLVRLPAQTSVEPGDVVDVRLGDTYGCDGCSPAFYYTVASPAPEPGSSLAGDLVSFGPPRGSRNPVVFHDPAAEETMYAFDDGSGDPLMVAGVFGFSWRASLSRHGQARVEVTAADQAAEIRRITLDVTDAAPLPGCKLANGLQGCPAGPCPAGFCSSPPPRQQTARVYDHIFSYGELPLVNGQPVTIDGTPTPITLGDPYIIRACVTWYAYFTPQDDRLPDADPNGQESCGTIRIAASQVTGNPFGPFSPARLAPIHIPGP
jgi:hypothetical protein